MVFRPHVLVGSILSIKFKAAYLTIERRCPVIQSIHVLRGSMPRCKVSMAGLAVVSHGETKAYDDFGEEMVTEYSSVIVLFVDDLWNEE